MPRPRLAPTAPIALTLDQDDLPARLVQIGQQTYRLRSDGEFTMAEGLRFRRLVTQFTASSTAANERDLTDDEALHLSTIVRGLCRLATDAPDGVIDGLREEQRCAIVSMAFFSQPLVVPPTPAGATEPRPTRRGSRRSRG